MFFILFPLNAEWYIIFVKKLNFDPSSLMMVLIVWPCNRGYRLFQYLKDLCFDCSGRWHTVHSIYVSFLVSAGSKGYAVTRQMVHQVTKG